MTTTSPPTQASNAELVRWAFDAVDRQDLDAIRQFWNEDTVERFPDRVCRGTDEIAAYFEEAFAALSNFHMKVVSIAETGDDVFVHWHMTGTHTGTLLGIEATGKELAIDGIDHFVIRDGRVVSNFVVFDQMQYGRQLGLMPPDGSALDKGMKATFNAATRVAGMLKR